MTTPAQCAFCHGIGQHLPVSRPGHRMDRTVCPNALIERGAFVRMTPGAMAPPPPPPPPPPPVFVMQQDQGTVRHVLGALVGCLVVAAALILASASFGW